MPALPPGWEALVPADCPVPSSSMLPVSPRPGFGPGTEWAFRCSPPAHRSPVGPCSVLPERTVGCGCTPTSRCSSCVCVLTVLSDDAQGETDSPSSTRPIPSSICAAAAEERCPLKPHSGFKAHVANIGTICGLLCHPRDNQGQGKTHPGPGNLARTDPLPEEGTCPCTSTARQRAPPSWKMPASFGFSRKQAWFGGTSRGQTWFGLLREVWLHLGGRLFL